MYVVTDEDTSKVGKPGVCSRFDPNGSSPGFTPKI